MHRDLDSLILRFGGDPTRLREWQPDLSDEELEPILDPSKDSAALLELTGSPHFGLQDLARFLVQAGYLRGCRRKGFWMNWSADIPLANYSKTHSPPLTLAELDDALHGLGVDRNFLGELKLFAPHGPALKLASSIDYFQSRPELLEQALGLRSGVSRTLPFWFKDAAGGRVEALTLLADFPEIPDKLLPRIWELALEGPIQERECARRALGNRPGVLEHLLESLLDRKAPRRGSAAAWLAESRSPEAVEPLRVALKREKVESVAISMLRALEARGQSVDDFLALDPLPRPIPTELSWFPFDSVGPPAARELIARAWKLKNPEPTPLQVRYAELHFPGEKEKLGEFVLAAWMGHDDQIGSAIADKGLLAVAGAWIGNSGEALVRNYLKQHYGNRAAQCKALLTMLAWMDAPWAGRILLATANGFRTRGIQKLAQELVLKIAERRGWSPDELADRSVATNVDKPRELKRLVTEQRRRFYLAMCLQRHWSGADWREFVLGHPVLREMAEQLIWCSPEAAAFRPLADGTLTDVEHGEIRSELSEVWLAHSLHFEQAVQQSWLEHLSDYKLIPLLQQFGQPVFRLAEDKQDELMDQTFRGKAVNTLILRAEALGLGWTRGPNDDGAYFSSYRKAFPTVGLEVILEFSGSELPEKSAPAELECVRFEVKGRPVPLGQVHPVLYSETLYDMYRIAAKGQAGA